MYLANESRVGIGALLSLQLLTSFTAIGLLGRVASSIERVMVDNVTSEESVETMLATLASVGVDGVGSAESAVAYEQAFLTASSNVTEPGEQELVDRIGRTRAEALAGDPAARLVNVEALHALGRLNRDSIREADQKAQLMASSGAWGSAFAGFVSLLLSAFVYRQTRDRLVAPVREMHEALAAVRRGDRLRRSHVHSGPVETRRMADDLNWLVENLCEAERQPPEAAALRPHLLALLEQLDHPVVILDMRGQPVAVNQLALDVADALPRSLGEALVQGRPLPPGWICTPTPQGSICARPSPPAAPPEGGADRAPGAAG